MNLEMEGSSLIELAIATVGGLAAVGMIILKFALRGFEAQQAATRELIEERFQWAEQQRQEARSHWEEHFAALRKDDDRLSARISQIEHRVSQIERHLHSIRMDTDK